MRDTVDRSLEFMAGGGKIGALMRCHNWANSPLGYPATWPQSLRSVVGLLLESRFPMFVAWGKELGLLYNDAYAEILGEKHPRALGARFQDIWSEIWPDISPLIASAMAGDASYREDLVYLLLLAGAERGRRGRRHVLRGRRDDRKDRRRKGPAEQRGSPAQPQRNA